MPVQQVSTCEHRARLSFTLRLDDSVRNNMPHSWTKEADVRTLLATSVFILIVLAGGSQSAENAPIAIVGARLIDGSGAAPVDDSVVIVEGDRIRDAGPRARVSIPAGATVVNAAGKTLMPGLVDVHCHINQPVDDMKRYWIAQLRWGVTTMRSAGND